MKDQPKIKGYRDLTPTEIDTINALKHVAEGVGEIVDKLAAGRENFDQRWVAIGKTHLQQGFMALVRAVAMPESF